MFSMEKEERIGNYQLNSNINNKGHLLQIGITYMNLVPKINQVTIIEGISPKYFSKLLKIIKDQTSISLNFVSHILICLL